MIVRIMGEGQVKLDDSHFAELNKLDDELLAEMETRRRGGLPPHPRRPARRGAHAGHTAARRRAGTVRADPARPRTPPSKRSGRCSATTASSRAESRPAAGRALHVQRQRRRPPADRGAPCLMCRSNPATGALSEARRWLRAHPYAVDALVAVGAFLATLAGAVAEPHGRGVRRPRPPRPRPPHRAPGRSRPVRSWCCAAARRCRCSASPPWSPWPACRRPAYRRPPGQERCAARVRRDHRPLHGLQPYGPRHHLRVGAADRRRADRRGDALRRRAPGTRRRTSASSPGRASPRPPARRCAAAAPSSTPSASVPSVPSAPARRRPGAGSRRSGCASPANCTTWSPTTSRWSTSRPESPRTSWTSAPTRPRRRSRTCGRRAGTPSRTAGHGRPAASVRREQRADRTRTRTRASSTNSSTASRAPGSRLRRSEPPRHGAAAAARRRRPHRLPRRAGGADQRAQARGRRRARGGADRTGAYRAGDHRDRRRRGPAPASAPNEAATPTPVEPGGPGGPTDAAAATA